MNVITIKSTSIIPILEGDLVLDGNSTVRCEGLDICKIVNGIVTHIACAEPHNGLNPRYDALSKDVIFLEHFRPKSKCEKCIDGWIEIDSKAGYQNIVIIKTFGIFRGIVLR